MADNIQLPEELTIGEVTYKVKETPELKTFVTAILSKAQTDERKKLYQRIESLEKSVLDLNTENESLKVAPQQVTSETIHRSNDQKGLKEEIKMINASTPVTMEAVSELISKAFTDNLPGLLKQSIDPFVKKLEATTQEQVADYRERRLRELNDSVIPELIKGSSKEEIEESIVNAIAVRQRYATPAEPITPQVVQQTTPAARVPATPAPPVPAKVEGNPPIPTAGEDIKNMSAEEFAKNRVALLSKLSKENVYPTLNQQ